MKYENRFKVKDDVYDSLSDDYNENTANMLAKKLNKNWYTITRILMELLIEDRVEKLDLGHTTYWKRKKDNELRVI